MAFGADTNAHTSFDETVYKIDIPDASDAHLKDGMRLLSDYASGMLLEAAQIDSERGVILAEKSSRDTAEYRAFIAEWAQILENSPYASKLPIGREDVIKNSPREVFEKFYRENYRPENMLIAISGDADPAKIMAFAREVFAVVKPSSAFAARPAPKRIAVLEGSYAPTLKSFIKGASIKAHIDPELKNASAEIFAISNPRFEDDTYESRIDAVKYAVIEYALSRRFEKIASKENAGIYKGDCAFQNIYNEVDAAFVSALAPCGESAQALKTAAEELERALAYGLTDSEVEEAKARILNGYEKAVAAKSTRQTVELANKLAATFAPRKVFTSPEDELAMAKEALSAVTPASCAGLLRDEFSRGRIGCFITDTKPLDYEPQKVLEEVARATLAAPQTEAKKEFAYLNFGPAGKIVSENRDEELGVTRLVFENGVRANLKRTDYAADNVIVCADVGLGKLDIPADSMKLAIFADAVFVNGGTVRQSRDDIASIFAGKNVALDFSSADNSFKLAGATTPKDLHLQLALFRAYLLDAGFRRDALSKAQKEIAELYNGVDSTPEGTLRANALKTILNGNARFGLPPRFEPSEADFAALESILKPVLKNAYLEISIVGDIDEARVKELLSEIFASMPPREKSRRDVSKEMVLSFSDSRKSTITFASALPRAISFAAWKSVPMKEIKTARACTLLGEVFDDVLRKDIREKLGKVYSPFAYNNSSRVYDMGFLFAGSMVESGGADGLSKLIAESGRKLAGNIDADMFERAKKPMLKQIEKMRRSNGYWCDNVLSLCQAEPVKLDWARTMIGGFEAVTLEDVNAVSKRVLLDAEPYEMLIIPAAPQKTQKSVE